MAAGRIEIVNTELNPASDEALVRAVIAYANGEPVGLGGSGVSQAVHMTTDKAKEMLTGIVWRFKPKRKRRRDQTAEDERRENVEGNKGLSMALTEFSNIPSNLEVDLRFTRKTEGYIEIEYFRRFRTLGSALAFAIVALLDPRKQLGQALAGCACCGRFRLIGRQVGPGRTRRDFCDDECMEKAHNARGAKRMRKPK